MLGGILQTSTSQASDAAHVHDVMCFAISARDDVIGTGTARHVLWSWIRFIEVYVYQVISLATAFFSTLSSLLIWNEMNNLT